jgi:hypothetical protein
MSFIQDNTPAPQEGASSGPTWEDMVTQMSFLSSQLSQQSEEIDRLNRELSSSQATTASAQAEASPPPPSLVDTEEDSDVLYPEEIRGMFRKPFLEFKKLQPSERAKLMEEAGVPGTPALTPYALPPMWEEFIKNKTMTVKTFYDEHLLQAQFRHLDAIRFATFYVSEVMAQLTSYELMASQEDGDEPDLHTLGIALLTLLRDSQTAQALAGREELAKHTGTTKALATPKGPNFFSEGDMTAIEANNKHLAQMRALQPKQRFSGNSSSRPQAGRGKKPKRFATRATPPTSAAPKQAEGSTSFAGASTSSKPSKK